MRRVVHDEARPGVRLPLSPEDREHLVRVLRLRAGDEVEVGDGRGRVFRARLRGGGALEVGQELPPPPPPAPVSVALAVLRRARMDWAVEKLSELGVARLVPLLAGRAVGEPRPERWRRLALESAKQCGRGTLLAVEEPVAPAALAAPEAGTRLVLDPDGEPFAAEMVGSGEGVAVVGPEGGFTGEEAEALVRAGFRRVRLALPVLRAETAAIAAAALLVALHPGARAPRA